MTNNNGNLEKLQQRNRVRMTRSPQRIQDMIDIGVEDLDTQYEREIAKDEVLTKFQPHEKGFFERGSVFQIHNYILSIMNRKTTHRNNVLQFVSELYGSADFRKGAMFGLGGAFSTRVVSK